MRDENSPTPLRLKVTGIVAPYIHPKGKPNEVDETGVEMKIVEDPYGFDPEMLKSLHQDVERLRALEPSGLDCIRPEYKAELQKAKQTPEYLELEKRIADKFPANYNELDSRQDRARLTELEAESKTRPLHAAEEVEQKHLQARLEVYSQTPQAADCSRMNSLRALRADLRFPEEEEEELKSLEAR